MYSANSHMKPWTQNIATFGFTSSVDITCDSVLSIFIVKRVLDMLVV